MAYDAVTIRPIKNNTGDRLSCLVILSPTKDIREIEHTTKMTGLLTVNKNTSIRE